MIEYFTHGLPSTVEIAGQRVDINTTWKLSAALDGAEDTFDDRELLLWVLLLYFGEKTTHKLPHLVEAHPEEALTAALAWRSAAFECMSYGKYGPSQHKKAPRERLLSFDADAAIIACDFLHYYHIDLLTDRMHWYRFVMLLMGLVHTPESLIGKATQARAPIPGSVKGEERKRLRRLKEAWALPLTHNELVEDIKNRF